MRLYTALVHHPVYGRDRAVITSALTSLDLHDLARSARTFGVERTFMITPIEQQRALIDHVGVHWRERRASSWHANRAEALARVAALPTIAEAVEAGIDQTGQRPALVATSARPGDEQVTFEALGARLARDPQPMLLLFGTAWGLTDEVVAACDARLEPVSGVDQYNHLSVRAAAAIILDRLTRAAVTPSDPH